MAQKLIIDNLPLFSNCEYEDQKCLQLRGGGQLLVKFRNLYAFCARKWASPGSELNLIIHPTHQKVTYLVDNHLLGIPI